VQRAIADSSLDALLYMGRTWESSAFTSQHNFANCSDEDIKRVIAVNLLAPIRLVKALLPALRQADNPKMIFIGALSGLDNFPAKEVDNTASKLCLGGVAHALWEELCPQRIGVTIINPGNIDTPEVLEDLRQAGQPKTDAIPLTDLLNVIDCVISISCSTCIKEIQMPAMNARGA